MTPIEKSGLALYLAGLSFLVLVVVTGAEAASVFDKIMAVVGTFIGLLVFVMAGKDEDK